MAAILPFENFVTIYVTMRCHERIPVLKMAAILPYETFVTIYKTVRHHKR